MQNAIIRGLYVGPKNVKYSEPAAHLRIDWGGVVGDRHHGLTRPAGKREKQDYAKGTVLRNNRQVSMVSTAEQRQIASILGVQEVKPEWLGANILLDGVPELTHIPPLTRLFCEGGVVIVVYGENIPCTPAGEEINRSLPHIAASSFPRAAIGRRGVVGWIEQIGKGTLFMNERVAIKLPTGKS